MKLGRQHAQCFLSSGRMTGFLQLHGNATCWNNTLEIVLMTGARTVPACWIIQVGARLSSDCLAGWSLCQYLRHLISGHWRQVGQQLFNDMMADVGWWCCGTWCANAVDLCKVLCEVIDSRLSGNFQVGFATVLVALTTVPWYYLSTSWWQQSSSQLVCAGRALAGGRTAYAK